MHLQKIFLKDNKWLNESRDDRIFTIRENNYLTIVINY